MQFDSADLASMEASGSLYGVILHEMGHVLGIGTSWAYRGLLTGASSRHTDRKRKLGKKRKTGKSQRLLG